MKYSKYLLSLIITFCSIVSNAASITVTYPNGGENLYQGQSVTITWSSVGTTAAVNIELTDANGLNPVVIVTNASNTGSYPWNISLTQSVGNYKIKIYTPSNTAVLDLSNAAFHILAPTLTVNYPNGGETFYQGGSMPISWSTVGMSSSENVSIEIVQGANTTAYQVIASPISNSGSFNWNIPNSFAAGAYRIKIYRTNTSAGTILDYSNTTFTIAIPILTVTSPNGGEIFYQGQLVTITWLSVGTTAPVNIELTDANGLNPVIIVSNTGNTGSYLWNINLTQVVGIYKIKIYTPSNTAINDLSNAAFNILAPTITVTYPNGGENFYQGQSVTITWSSVGTTAPVNIELTDANGLNPVIIVSNTSNTGSYLWNINLAQVIGNYRIKIYTPSNTAINDLSNAAFHILAPTITVTYSNGGETFYQGSTMPISWSTVGIGASENISIEIVQGANTIAYQVIASPISNSGLFNWNILSSFAAGSYRIKIYRTNTASGIIVDYSDATFTIAAPTLTVILPNGGETYSMGNTLVVNWTSTGVAGNIQIELENQTTTVLYRFGTAGTGVAASLGTFSGIIGDTIVPGLYKVKIYSLLNTTIKDFSNANFTINGFMYNCIQWQPYPAPSSVPTSLELNSTYATAFEYLCNKHVIDAVQYKNQINNKIRRDQVAKIAYRSLYTPNITSPFPCDNFPNIYPDLIPSLATYIGEAKSLMYLEYRDATSGDLDGISPFDRDNTYFNPTRAILKKFYLKVLLEAFNKIPVSPVYTVGFPAGVFTDVPASDESRGYIKKALDLGIIDATATFGVIDSIVRKDAFLILYKLMKSIETGGIYTAPAPTLNDYFQPNNFGLANSNFSIGIDKANFNSYTKTSFGIAGLMPLVFEHSYNSVLTEQPNQNSYDQPLGSGWTHNYNCYITRTVDDETNNARVTIHWGDGTSTSYTENGLNYISESVGNYATLTRNITDLVYKTKSQMVYTFSFQNSSFWTLNTVKDRNNNTLSFGWLMGVNSKYRLNSVTDPAGRKLQYNYLAGTNLLSNVQAITGSITRIIFFSFSNNNTDLASFTDPRGKISSYTYESITNPARAHLLSNITLPKGNVIHNTYRDRKLISSNFVNQYKTDVTFNQTYTANNNTNFTQSTVTTTKTTGQTLATTITHNMLGLTRSLQSPAGNLNINYDATQTTKPILFNNLTTGLSVVPTYDAMGNVLSITRSGIGITSITENYTYNTLNAILTYQNGRGYTTTFGYNNTGNLTSISDALGNITTMLVNSNGTVQRVTNPTGIYSDFTYNTFGNTISTSLQGIINSSATYDDASRLLQTTDPRNIKTYRYYLQNNLISRVVSDTGGLNNGVNYLYDDNDNLTTTINPKGGATTLTYNGLDQLITYSFGGFSKTYTYNEDGTLKTSATQNGYTFNYTYNTDGAIQNDGYAAYTYDLSNKNLNNITKGSNTISYNYDGLNRANNIGYNDFATNNVLYTYDANNNITSITYPGGFKVGYEYDALDRLTRVYNFLSATNYATYTYLADGRLNTQTNGNSTITNYHYDAIGRLDSIANTSNGNTVLCAYGFGLDNVGNHTRETINEPNAPSPQMLTTETINYSHDAANRMLSRASTNFTEDANGNNTSANGQWNSTYTYDAKDNLLTSSNPVLSCEYDGLENRRLKNSTRYVLDILGGANVLMETNTSGTPQSYYIHGLGLICRLDAAQSNPEYYHYDYRGSTTAITNSTQTVTHRYKYGPFGEILAAQETGFVNTFRYVGKYGVQFDDSTLYFMRARYYNAYKGRFLGEDPIWNLNLYGYSGNNPISNIDPNGKLPSWIGVVADLAKTYGLALISYYDGNNHIKYSEQYFNNGNMLQKRGLMKEAIRQFANASEEASLAAQAYGEAKSEIIDGSIETIKNIISGEITDKIFSLAQKREIDAYKKFINKTNNSAQAKNFLINLMSNRYAVRLKNIQDIYELMDSANDLADEIYTALDN
jgi:RHS repeat-associated protein